MKVLAFDIKDSIYKTKYEIHILQPGEVFPRFGGSRHGLLVKKTPSLIVRETATHGLKDTEYDVNNEGIWRWIGKLMDVNRVAVITPDAASTTED